MSHKHSQVHPPSNERALFIGIRPEAFGPEDLPPGMTVEDLAGRVERGQAAIAAAGIEAAHCLIGFDPDGAEAAIREHFASSAYGLAMIGGGIRLLPEHTVLFERIVNVLIDLQPRIRLSFNTDPENSIDALRRWLDR
ncbi:hypothetical protein [Glycomyces sp. YM15]|uniref:hypothetical protein n=1 Tax=Glycomyces sp. YM15 TaxID=2800446 RepID=UPI0019629BC3|nr:hypothetical protein [Glycomyces sp. YM15]